MKRLVLCMIACFIFNCVNSQMAIRITVDRQSTVQVTKSGNDKEKNTLVIDNKSEKDSCAVIISTSLPSVFSFGRKGKISLKKGENIFRFTSSGLVPGYPDRQQKLHSPFELVITDKNDSDLLRKTVVYPPVDRTVTGPTTPPIIDTSKNKNDSSKQKSVSKDSLTEIPYYDAFMLLNYKNINGEQFEKILNYYSNSTNLAGNNLSDAYKDNLFLHNFVDSALIFYDKSLVATPNFGDFIGKGLSSIGGLDVTSLADGAAKFIVKRAKQELSISFFRKFKDVIIATPDIGTVFPQTSSLLDALDEEIYEYEKYIQNLREAFKKDIHEIHRNLPGIIDNHAQFFSKHQEVKAALLSACYTAQELEDQAHPGDMLANYPVEYLDSIENKNYKGSIQTIQLLSASLRDTAAQKDANYWVGIRQIMKLVNDKTALKIYLGLLLQEAKVKYGYIPFEGTNLVDLLNAVAKKYEEGFSTYNSYRSYILRFGEKVDALNKMIKDHSQDNLDDSSKVEKYAKYFRTSVDLLAYSTEAFQLPVINKLDSLKHFTILLKKYFDVAYAGADLVADINRKNYSSSINDAVHIYNVVAVKSAREEKEKEEKGAVKGSKISAAADYNTFKTVLDKLVRYGSFMATISTAKSSDEVENAIESAALPVGSSRIKRVSDFSVSLNAYAGLFYGIERIKGVDSGKSKFNTYGVTAPIGVAASWGHRFLVFPTGKHEWSTSLFVSLIDIGAITAFRFTDDSTAQIPTVRLKNIFSPGAFLSIGIPKTPLSFNVGTQVGPNLRKVNINPVKGNDFSDKMYWRFSASLAVDIPILNFYNKSR